MSDTTIVFFSIVVSLLAGGAFVYKVCGKKMPRFFLEFLYGIIFLNVLVLNFIGIGYKSDNPCNIICLDSVISTVKAFTFKVNFIVNERLDATAIKNAQDYEIAKNKGNTDQKNYIKIVGAWSEIPNFKRESNRYATMSIPIKLNLLGIKSHEDGTPQISEQDYWSKYDPDNDRKSSPPYKTEKTSINDKGVDFIFDTPRNNLARLEHQRWNAFHLVNGWTKLPKSSVTGAKRQNAFTKQHACITTFEGLSELRDIQAKSLIKNNPQTTIAQAQDVADTIKYDYTVMDNLFNSHFSHR